MSAIVSKVPDIPRLPHKFAMPLLTILCVALTLWMACAFKDEAGDGIPSEYKA